MSGALLTMLSGGVLNFQPTFTDNFNRADQTNGLGTGYTYAGRGASPQNFFGIANQGALFKSTGGNYYEYAFPPVGTQYHNCFVQADLGPGIGGNTAGLVLAWSADGATSNGSNYSIVLSQNAGTSGVFNLTLLDPNGVTIVQSAQSYPGGGSVRGWRGSNGKWNAARFNTSTNTWDTVISGFTSTYFDSRTTVVGMLNYVGYSTTTPYLDNFVYGAVSV